MIVFVFDMTPIYKNQYDWGWFGDNGKETLKMYVQTHALTPKGYKEITGDDYIAETNQKA